MRWSRTEAGSSLGSWGTSLPSNAFLRMAWRRRAARGGNILGKPDAVFGGLDFDADQGHAGLLGFHHAGCVSIDIEEVVGKAMPRGERKFANGYAAAGFNVDCVAILDEPPGIR